MSAPSPCERIILTRHPSRLSRTAWLIALLACSQTRISTADDAPPDLRRGSVSMEWRASTEPDGVSHLAPDVDRSQVTEFFMEADRSSPSPSNSQQSTARTAEHRRPPARIQAQSDATDQDLEPALFFMQPEPPPEPAPPAPNLEPLPVPVPSPPHPGLQPQSDSRPPGFQRVSPRARPAASRPSTLSVEHNRLRSMLQSAVCGWEAVWVNWRCGSDYLEGCMPQGYTALPLINTIPPAVQYSTPLNINGPVEPGGSPTDSAYISGSDTTPMKQLSFNVAPPAGELPEDVAQRKFAMLASRTQLPGTHRTWAGMAYYWDASHLVHQPLYFEDVNLERHGYSCGIAQPLVSATRFFATFPILPYLVAAEPHYSAIYTLGERRPGSPAPYVHDLPPISPHAAAFEAAVVTGLFFVIP